MCAEKLLVVPMVAADSARSRVRVFTSVGGVVQVPCANAGVRARTPTATLVTILFIILRLSPALNAGAQQAWTAQGETRGVTSIFQRFVDLGLRSEDLTVTNSYL